LYNLYRLYTLNNANVVPIYKMCSFHVWTTQNTELKKVLTGGNLLTEFHKALPNVYVTMEKAYAGTNSMQGIPFKN
jgi:hypothetical protein